MKIVFISDIHANYDALSVLAADIKSADQVLCLGDIVGYHSQVNEVIDFLRNLPNLICVMGNHDSFLLNGCPSHLSLEVRYWIDFANNIIRSDNREWLQTLPITWGGYLDKLSFLLVHGSPWHPFTDYLYVDNPLLHQLQAFHYDIISFGQTHRALTRTETKPFLINPGSIGQSRDRKGLACALELETKTMTFRRIEQPFKTVAGVMT